MGEEKTKGEEINSGGEIKPTEIAVKNTKKDIDRRKLKAAIILVLTIFAAMIYIVWVLGGLEP